MKKNNLKIIVFMLGVLLLLGGCVENKTEHELKEDEQTIIEDEQTTIQDEQTEDEEIEEKQEDVSKNDEKKDTLEQMIVHYINFDTGERKQEKIEEEGIEPESIWEELQNKGLLTTDCEINSYIINEDDKSITLDVNEGFGVYIRSMGTTGESEIIFCVVNSFLDTYGCEKLKITEKGNVFETGHKVYD